MGCPSCPPASPCSPQLSRGCGLLPDTPAFPESPLLYAGRRETPAELTCSRSPHGCAEGVCRLVGEGPHSPPRHPSQAGTRRGASPGVGSPCVISCGLLFSGGNSYSEKAAEVQTHYILQELFWLFKINTQFFRAVLGSYQNGAESSDSSQVSPPAPHAQLRPPLPEGSVGYHPWPHTDTPSPHGVLGLHGGSPSVSGILCVRTNP